MRQSISIPQFLWSDHLRTHKRKQSYCTGLGTCEGSNSSIHDVKVFLGFCLGSESENGGGSRIRTQGGNSLILRIHYRLLSCLRKGSRPDSETNYTLLLEYHCVCWTIRNKLQLEQKTLNDSMMPLPIVNT